MSDVPFVAFHVNLCPHGTSFPSFVALIVLAKFFPFRRGGNLWKHYQQAGRFA